MFFQMSCLLFPQINLTRTGHVSFKASWQPGNISLKSRIVLNLDLTTNKKISVTECNVSVSLVIRNIFIYVTLDNNFK